MAFTQVLNLNKGMHSVQITMPLVGTQDSTSQVTNSLGIFGCFDVRVTSDSDVGSLLDFG